MTRVSGCILNSLSFTVVVRRMYACVPDDLPSKYSAPVSPGVNKKYHFLVYFLRHKYMIIITHLKLSNCVFLRIKSKKEHWGRFSAVWVTFYIWHIFFFVWLKEMFFFGLVIFLFCSSFALFLPTINRFKVFKYFWSNRTICILKSSNRDFHVSGSAIIILTESAM